MEPMALKALRIQTVTLTFRVAPDSLTSEARLTSIRSLRLRSLLESRLKISVGTLSTMITGPTVAATLSVATREWKILGLRKVL